MKRTLALLLIVVCGCTATPEPSERQVATDAPVETRTAKQKPKRTPRPTPQVTFGPLRPGADGSFVLDDDSLGTIRFGTPSGQAIERIERRLGSPTFVGKWHELKPWTDPYGHNPDTYADEADQPFVTWTRPAWREVCWNMLCIFLGRNEDRTETFVAWRLSAFETAERYVDGDPDRPTPDLRTVKGLGIGTTWGEVRRLYPKSTFSHGEGTSFGYSIGWKENCDGAICANGRLETGTVLTPTPTPKKSPAPAECGIGGRDVSLGCPPRDARVISLMAGDLVHPTCC